MIAYRRSNTLPSCFTLFFLLVFFIPTLHAEIRWLPVIASTPETGLQYGVLLLQSLDEEAVDGKLSSIQYVAINSTEKQQRLVVRPTLYYFDYKLKLEPLINYSSFPEKYYGIGNDTQENSEEDFSSDYLFLKMRARYQLVSELHLLMLASRDDREITEFEANGEIDSLLASSQLDEYTLHSRGGGLVWDTRDQPRYPDKGYYVELSREAFQGSSYDYHEDRIDLRAYYSIGEKQVLAGHLLQVKQDGDKIPFINLSTIGGSDVVRGIFEGRYRAPEMEAAQIEYRKYGYDILGLQTGFTVFAASGRVLEAFPGDDDKLHSAVGLGGHFFFNPEDRTTIRFDLAYGDEELGVYLMIDQAF